MYYEGLGSIRKEPAPKKTGVGYKVFFMKDGKLYPPMVANPGGVDTPIGVWLDADAAPIVGNSKTGRPQVKNGGKGTQGGSGTLAYRPGWHLGLIPYAIQFNRKDENGEKTLFPKDFVWAEVEYAADKNYQKEAEAEGYTENGKYRHSYAGLKHLPTDGYYIYRTNPNPETDPWIITGAMKVNRILSNEEVDDLVMKAGREPQRREGEGLGFASFHISKNEDEFLENIDEAIEKNGVVREDVCDLDFPILSLLPIKFNHKGNLLSFIRKTAEEKNIIGSHKVLVGDSIGVVNISNKFFKKALSEKATLKSDNKELQYVSSLNIIEILNNSLDVEIHPNVIKVDGDRIFKNDNIDKKTLIHRLFSAISYNGDYYRIKITLKENYKQKNTVYTVENMKIELLPPSKGTPREHLVTSNSIPSAILLKGVEKSYEKGIFLLNCCKNAHKKQIGRADTSTINQSQQFQNRRQARASQLKKGDKITYTEDDFFRVECDDLKRVHDAIKYWMEIGKKELLPVFDDLLLDENGYPIYTVLENAEAFIDNYEQYKDEWKKDFLFANKLRYDDAARSWVTENNFGGEENLYKNITKVHHKPSLLLIYDWMKKSVVHDYDDEEREKYINSFFEKVKKYIDSLNDDELIDKMVNAYKRAFSPNVTIPKNITLSDCYKYCKTDDENKKAYSGIYHDPNGFAVLTNGQYLYAHKNLYEYKNKEKIVDKSGKVVDKKFPDWQRLVDSMRNKISININRDDLYRKLCMYERKFKYRSHHNTQKPFSITDGEKTYFFDADLLRGLIFLSYAHKDVKFSLSPMTWQGKEVEGSAYFIIESSDGSIGLCNPGIYDNGGYDKEVNKYGLIRDLYTDGEPFLLDSVYQYAQVKQDGKKSNNLQLAKAKMKMAAARMKLMKM